jgi:hypothetical protein
VFDYPVTQTTIDDIVKQPMSRYDGHSRLSLECFKPEAMPAAGVERLRVASGSVRNDVFKPVNWAFGESTLAAFAQVG